MGFTGASERKKNADTMRYYIDMHNPIIPRVDDGSNSMDESMALIDMEYKEGVRKLICTPHYIRNRNNYDYDRLESVFEKLKAKVVERYPDMELYLGNEVLCENGIIDDIRNGRLIHTMAGSRYVLFEFNIRIPYHELYEMMRAMVELRVFPIIAHVERYQALIGRLDRIEELKGLGIYLQVNADSIEGGFFDDKTRWVRKLIIGGYIEFVSTDCHDTDSRSPSINKAAEWVRKKCGLDVAEALFGVNADIIIKNKYIEIAN